MNILIPNGPDVKNLGDVAIYESLVSSLKQKRHQVIAHRFDPRAEKGIEVRPNIYYWAVFQNRNLFVRITRTFLLLTALFLPSGLEPLLPKALRSMLSDYKKADKVILKGGGYFRSRPGLTQQINAVMNCVYILFAKKYEKTIIIRPMSFGPFANKVSEWICAKCVGLAGVIQVRDRVSYDLLQKYVSPRKLQRKPDEAFLLSPAKIVKPNQKILGFTVREWVEKPKRQAFIKNMATLIEQTAFEKGCSLVQPIVQVDAPEYSEGDEKITKDLSNLLKKRGMKIKKTLKPKTVSQAQRAYGRLSFLVGMRMHSCIFAHIQDVPFTVIAYEHKHSSLARLADEVIPIESLSADKGLRGPMTSAIDTLAKTSEIGERSG